MENQINVGSSESVHTIIHKSVESFLGLTSFTNTYITITTIIGCAQQLKEQLQRGGEGGIVGRFNELMETRIGHMGCAISAFLILAFDFFDNAEAALFVSGIFILALVGLAFE